jgi:hypothetical protein
LHNVSGQQIATVDSLDLFEPGSGPLVDLITGHVFEAQSKGIVMEPYQVLWLTTKEGNHFMAGHRRFSSI